MIEGTSFFLVFRLKEKNVYVQVFTSSWQKYPCLRRHTFRSWFAAVRQHFFHLFSRSEQHDTMTQTLTPQYTSATLQVYYCRLWCELRVYKKGIALNYLFIPIYTNYTNTQQQQQKEKKHYHDINIVIREMIFFFFLNLPRPSHFSGMNKVYCYWILFFWFYF